MRRLLLIILILPGLALAGVGQLTEYSGPPLDSFTLESLDTGKVSLSDYKGKVVLVNFWATWCPPCVEEMPSMQALRDALADEPFEILAVNLGEDKATIREFLTQVKLEFPILLDPDGRTVESWKVMAFPSSFLVDRTGKIRYSLFGGYAWDHPDAIARVRALMQ